MIKKSAILVSVLGLAACGGNSGGGNGGGSVPRAYRYQDEVAISNAKITGLVARGEGQVASLVNKMLAVSDGQQLQIISRAATMARAGDVPGVEGAGSKLTYAEAKDVIDLALKIAAYSSSDGSDDSELSAAWENKEQFRKALKLLNSNVKCYVPSKYDETLNRIRQNSDYIEKVAENLKDATELFDVSAVKFNMVAGHFSGKGEMVSLGIDENGQIDKISLMDDEKFEGITRDGENPTFSFNNKKVYSYKIEVQHKGENDPTHEYKSDGQVSVADIKSDLLAKLKEGKAAAKQEYGDVYDAAIDEVNELTEESMEQVDDDSSNGYQLVSAKITPKLIGIEGGTSCDDKTGDCEDVAMRYADFGLIKMDMVFHKVDGGKQERPIIQAIYGGYDTNRVDLTKVSDDLEFNGKAIGLVQYREYGGEGVGVIDTEDLNLNGTAKLTFDKSTGEQDLVLKFNNWYDVNVKYKDDTANNSIKFDNWNENNDKLTFINKEKLGFIGQRMDSANAEDIDTENYDYNGEFEVGYWGKEKDPTTNNKPIEAAGFVKVGEFREDGNDVLFMGAFGGVKK